MSGLSGSGIELSRRDNNSASRAHAALRHRQSKQLNLGPVPLEYLQEYFGVAVLPVQSLSDQQRGLRYVALFKAAGVPDMKVDEVAADHGHDFVPSRGGVTTFSVVRQKVSASGVQVRRSDHYAAVCVAHPLQFRECETFDFGKVPDINCDELPVIHVRPACPRSIQEGGPGNPASFCISTVLHNEINVVVTRNSHDGDPPPFTKTRGGSLGSVR